MSEIKTVELPVTLVRWLTTLAEDGLYTEPHLSVGDEEMDKRVTLLDSAIDACEEDPEVRSGSDPATSYHIAARDMAAWKDRRDGLTWAQLCGITRTLEWCRSTMRAEAMSRGELDDLDTLEELARRAAGECP